MHDEQTGGLDVGSDMHREPGDEPLPGYRDAAPDPLALIDPNAPVGGHPVDFSDPPAASLSPEHDWSAAAPLIFPLLHPAGTAGIHLAGLDAASLLATPNQSHAQPLIDDGPCGLAVVYAIAASGFDVIVNGDHLVSWGVRPEAIQDAAIANLAAWSATAPWSSEASDSRRILSSDTGGGWDATRILLPGVRAHLARELAGPGRILLGLPDRHLLVAGLMRPEDAEFGALFAEFVVEYSGGSDEPIDRRIFELVDERVVEFVA